ncbi:MAG: nucleotidyltransferase domain-containing protein [Bacteroidaceae bacterium]|nr:nucleotidyltransferase domain-containing protein [Bacteroidaceae bacterium]
MRRPEIVKRIAEAIKRVDPDAKTILYGSEARGDARPDSDIDLLVLLEGESRLSLNRQMEVTSPLYDIELETGVSISPMVMLKKDWENRPFRTPFYINVVNEGIVL